VVSGRVKRRGYDPLLYGNFLLIAGAGERRTYFYSHLRDTALVRSDEAVWAGQRVGGVGKTGNARTVGCHLHFEIRSRGRPIDPEPLLQRWSHRG
jgi:murein DD-endopeptidase MepM/ murein hydrolase activator NlpD